MSRDPSDEDPPPGYDEVMKSDQARGISIRYDPGLQSPSPENHEVNIEENVENGNYKDEQIGSCVCMCCICCIMPIVVTFFIWLIFFVILPILSQS